MNICYISYCCGAELRSALQEAGGKQKLLKGAAVATVGFRCTGGGDGGGGGQTGSQLCCYRGRSSPPARSDVAVAVRLISNPRVKS